MIDCWEISRKSQEKGNLSNRCILSDLFIFLDLSSEMICVCLPGVDNAESTSLATDKIELFIINLLDFARTPAYAI